MTASGSVNVTRPEARHEAPGPGSKDATTQPAATLSAAAPCAPEAPTHICGITRSTGTIEWVCVRPVHDTGANKNRGRQITGYHPQSERHHFVRKYPRRDP